MLNINDLERKWIKYKIKSYIPHLIILISFIIIFVLVFIVLNIQPKIKQDPVIEPILKKVELKSHVTAIIHEKSDDKKSETEIQNNNKIVLSPSLNFMNKIQESTMAKYKTQVISKIQPQKIKAIEVAKRKGLKPGRVKNTQGIQFTKGKNDRLEVIDWDEFKTTLTKRKLQVYESGGWMKIMKK